MVLNYIWIAFFLIAFAVALVRLVFLGDTQVFPEIINSTFSSSKTAFEISLGIPAGISGCVLSGSGSESDVQLQNNCTMNKRKTDRRNVVCILFSFLGIRLEGYFQKFQCKKKVKRDGGSHFP